MTQQEKLLPLAHRVLTFEESVETVARAHGVSEVDLKRVVRKYEKVREKLQREKEREELIPGIVKMAASFHIDGRNLEGVPEYEFEFPKIRLGTMKGPTKVYRPDVVWFAGEPSEETASVIFEIEDGMSPKHQMGGLALANLLALKFKRSLWFFAIVREGSEILSNSIELSKAYLGPKWALNPFVVHGFHLPAIRELVRGALQDHA